MEIIRDNIRTMIPGNTRVNLDIMRFVRENIITTWYLFAWLAVFTAFVGWFTMTQLQSAPGATIVILIVWALTVYMTVMAELKKSHTSLTFWLKENMYNSITNIEITLFLVLLILAAGRGFYNYAWVNASFSVDPITSNEQNYTATVEEVLANDRVSMATAPTGFVFDREVAFNAAGTPIERKVFTKNEDGSVDVVHTEIHTGATWGSVIDNFGNLFLFRFKTPELVWRVYTALGLLFALAIPSIFVYRGDDYRGKPIRRIMTALWVASPFIIFFLLYGIGESGPLQRVDPDFTWGGFLLTMIISIFAIVVSFPLGVLLALGRRSTIYGIPDWLTYSLTGIATVMGLAFSTPGNLAAARNTVESIVAFWPLLLPVIAYFLQRNFKGNIVAVFSTLYIEVVRGVPLITVLFMSIILFPIFLPPDWSISPTIRVLMAFALFSAAYLAENVRGGLQSIPKGQYEAADSLGLGAFNKYRLIILPQALRAVIPAIVGQFIGLFKDTSLVYLVGLFDFLAVANNISSQPNWLGIRTEPYILLMLVYFIGSSIMAGYSRRLERQLGVGER